MILMNMRQLTIFLEVCHHMSITKTARSLYLSQPAISKAIKELETEIDTPLFDRINGKIYLNEEGKLFRLKAKELLKDFEELKNFKCTYEDSTPIRVGVSLTIALKTLPLAIKSFKKKYPETPIQLYAENVEQIQKRLLNGDIDIAFTEDFEQNQLFYLEALSTYKMICVGSANSQWQQKPYLKKAELVNQSFLLRERGSTLRDTFDAFVNKEKLTIQPLLESVNTEILINATKHNLGLTILPAPLAQEDLANHELIEITIEDFNVYSTNYIVTLHGKKKSTKLKNLISCFKEFE